MTEKEAQETVERKAQTFQETVNDLSEDYIFVGDSQEIKAVAELLGLYRKDYPSLFVQQINGEITSVYYSDFSVPFLWHTVYKIF